MLNNKGGMGIKSEYYTLKGYRLKEKNYITEAMEDYIEMIYREVKDNYITIKKLSEKLNVKASSVSKMATKLKELNLINFEKYGKINLTNDGIILGKYLLHRHNILKIFFKKLNKSKYNLEQVEKVEHFIDIDTIYNLEKLITKF